MTGLAGHWAGDLDGIVVCKPTKISSLLVPSIFVNGPNDGAHMGLLARSLTFLVVSPICLGIEPQRELLYGINVPKVSTSGRG